MSAKLWLDIDLFGNLYSFRVRLYELIVTKVRRDFKERKNRISNKRIYFFLPINISTGKDTLDVCRFRHPTPLFFYFDSKMNSSQICDRFFHFLNLEISLFMKRKTDFS